MLIPFRGGPRHGLAVSCASIDQDVIEKLHLLTGMGTVRPEVIATKRTLYRWRVTTRSDVVRLLYYILPYMGERRSTRIGELLNYHADNPPLRRKREAVAQD